ncbi:hypothetical protein AB1K70_18100 [Bremerella sp. JC770]|uniref:hypothetical protein n=1 Tax=Bremerella sp. JC770 TaxID=3232137 RepID=UPI00345974F1
MRSQQPFHFPAWYALGCAFALLVFTGCFGSNGYPTTAPVEGLLLYQGKPLSDANISFIPAKGRPATATTNANGEFQLTTFVQGDGAIPGEHQVLIEKYNKPKSDDLYAPTTHAIPKRYSQIRTSPLRESVPSEGVTELRIELED